MHNETDLVTCYKNRLIASLEKLGFIYLTMFFVDVTHEIEDLGTQGAWDTHLLFCQHNRYCLILVTLREIHMSNGQSTMAWMIRLRVQFDLTSPYLPFMEDGGTDPFWEPTIPGLVRRGGTSCFGNKIYNTSFVLENISTEACTIIETGIRRMLLELGDGVKKGIMWL